MHQFSIAQIKEALHKVKSGADFPAYIQEIKILGVTHYDSFVADGHSDYYGAGNYIVSSAPIYEPIDIATCPDLRQFKADLLRHQQGQSDYLTFCADCGKSGIQKWQVSIQQMRCTYFDHSGNQVLVENIPS